VMRTQVAFVERVFVTSMVSGPTASPPSWCALVERAPELDQRSLTGERHTEAQ
jgi:hypothetical protein